MLSNANAHAIITNALINNIDMTAKETLYKHVSSDLTDRWPEPVLTAVLMAMEAYAQQQRNKPKKSVVVSDENDPHKYERNFDRNSRW